MVYRGRQRIFDLIPKTCSSQTAVTDSGEWCELTLTWRAGWLQQLVGCGTTERTGGSHLHESWTPTREEQTVKWNGMNTEQEIDTKNKNEKQGT